MQGNLLWILVAFMIYLVFMIVVGILYAKGNESSADFFLGGRQLTGPIAALSAQASDMSGWLLMGLPGSVYALGTGQSWIAIGLFIGTVCNWIFISGRLRRYTIRANNSLTLPTYFENRFHDTDRVLLRIASVTIVIFFLVYTASALAAGGKLFNSVFGIDYRVALTLGAVVILVYTFLGGFKAVCTTDFIQGNLMLVGLVLVPLIAYGALGGNMGGILEQTELPGGTAAFMDLFSNGESKFTFIDIFSQLAWGFGYCGMPHILVRFMAIKDETELKKSKSIAIIWVALSLFFAIFIGVVGRAYLFPEILSGGDEEKVFIEMIIKMFTQQVNAPIIGGIFLCGILAAIMSTADSQLLVSASSVAEDIYKNIMKKDATDEDVLKVSRISVILIAIIAYLIALNPNSSIMGLVSNAWSGFGSAFGPTVLLSLFWKRVNRQGAIAGIISGAATVIIWDYIPLMGGVTPGGATGLYSLAVGFPLSLIVILIVSLVTPPPSQEMMDEFEDVASGKVV